MAEPTTNRRRNFRLFEYLCSNMSDAELRTLLECAEEEWRFRQSRRRGGGRAEEDEREDDPPESERVPSGSRIEAADPADDEPRTAEYRRSSERAPSHITTPAGDKLVRRPSHGQGRPPRQR